MPLLVPEVPCLVWRPANQGLLSSNIDWELVIVDDGSPDGTQDVANELVKAYKPHVQLQTRTGKLGLGTAYVHGLQFAKGDRIIIMDADFSHHPKFIPQMIALQNSHDYDIVTGTRYAPGGGVFGWDLKRKLTSKGANIFADTVLRPGVSDLTGSFRLYKRPVLQKLFDCTDVRGFSMQMALAVTAKTMGYTIGEVPITFVDRVFGDSKLGTLLLSLVLPLFAYLHSAIEHLL